MIGLIAVVLMKYISNNDTNDSFDYHLDGIIYIKLTNNLTDDECMIAVQRWNNFCLNEDIINKFLIENNRSDSGSNPSTKRVTKPTLNMSLHFVRKYYNNLYIIKTDICLSPNEACDQLITCLKSMPEITHVYSEASVVFC
jgi:hypothetical protein